MTKPVWIEEALKHVGTREIPGAQHEPNGTLVFFKRSGYCFLRIHFVRGKSLVKSACVDAKSRFGRFKSEFFAKCGEFKRISLVVVLFFAGCPAAVIRGVAKIVVLSVKGVVIAWSWPHIFKEALESCFIAVANKPPVAHGNSASAIPDVASASRVVAASFHVAPNPLLCFVRSTMLGIGNLRSLWHRRFSNTSTVCGFAMSEVVGINKTHRTALASAWRFASYWIPGRSPFAKFFHGMTWFVGTKGLCHE